MYNVIERQKRSFVRHKLIKVNIRSELEGKARGGGAASFQGSSPAFCRILYKKLQSLGTRLVGALYG